MNGNFSIIEKFSCSKTGLESANEDGIYIGNNIVAVIDGATSKDGYTLNGKKGGQLARDIIINKLKSYSGLESMEVFVLGIQKELFLFAERYSIPHYSASMILYNSLCGEIWSIGDCQYWLNGVVQKNQKKVDQVYSEARAIALYSFLEAGYSETDMLEHDLARQQLMPFLQSQKYLENKKVKYGHCVFNGNTPIEEFPIEMVKVIKVHKNSELVLASDGYPILKGTLNESERELKRLILEDPLCYKENCSTKGVAKGNISFDDRTYVKIIVE